MLETALKYKSSGLSIIGCKDKQPVMNSWKPYQSRIAEKEELVRMFEARAAPQIAIICGAVSGNLEVIDVDDISIVDHLWEDISELFETPPVVFVKTQSGGAHIYYRCPTIQGNQKLARSAKDDTGKIFVRVETRGEGGYVIAPPSANYTVVSGSLENIPTIKEHEREDILDICRSFNLEFKEEKTKTVKGVDPSEYAETPWDKYNADEREPWQQILQDHGWEQVSQGIRQQWKRPGTKNKTSANWHTEKRIFYVHSSSTAFEPDKGYPPFSILAVLNHAGNFSEAAKAIIKQGYGVGFNHFEKSIIQDCLVNIDNFDDIDRFLSDNFDQITPELKSKVKIAVTNHQNYRGIIFWTLTPKGQVVFDEEKTARYLTSLGIYTLSSTLNSDNFKAVHIQKEKHHITEIGKVKGVVEIIKENIKTIDFNSFGVSEREVVKMLMKVTPQKWLNVLTWIEQMVIEELDILRDDKDNIYHLFNNSIVHITANEISTINYEDLPPGKLVWKSSIIDRDVYICATDNEPDLNQSSFYRFIKRLAGVPKYCDSGNEIALEVFDEPTRDRFYAMVTTIGYLSSNYKDSSNPKAVIIAEDTSDQGQGGGTGKSLLIKAINKLRNIVSLSGKDWNPDKSFVYQSVQIDTDLVCLEDTTKYFDFQRLYNVITDGMHIEKKNKDTIFLPYEISPKIAMTTNFDIGDDTEHSLRRQHKVLVSRYFNKNNSPLNEYKKRFFEDWNEDEWNWFFNILFCCNNAFLVSGLVVQKESLNMKIKAIKGRFTDDLFSYLWDKLNENQKYTFLLKESYKEFINEYGIPEKQYSGRRFNQGLRYFGDKLGLEVVEERTKQGENRNCKTLFYTGDFSFFNMGKDEKYYENPKNKPKIVVEKDPF